MPDNKFANSFAAIRQASGPEETSMAEAGPVGAGRTEAEPAGADHSTPATASVTTRPRTVESARLGAPRGAPTSPPRRHARTSAPTVAPPTAVSPMAAPERRGPGRPPGKRSDPEYRQITGLIRKDVHVAVLKQMLDEGRSRDMGALLEELLERHYLKRV